MQSVRGVNLPGMARLINAPWIDGLERLSLADSDLNAEGFEAFVHAPGLARLKLLSCQSTNVSGASFERVPQSVWCGSIEELDFGLCHINAPRSVTYMCERAQMYNLRKLNLRGVGITHQVIAAWRECDYFWALRDLCVSEHSGLGTSALTLLCTAP